MLGWKPCWSFGGYNYNLGPSVLPCAFHNVAAVPVKPIELLQNWSIRDLKFVPPDKNHSTERHQLTPGRLYISCRVNTLKLKMGATIIKGYNTDFSSIKDLSNIGLKTRYDYWTNEFLRPVDYSLIELIFIECANRILLAFGILFSIWW